MATGQLNLKFIIIDATSIFSKDRTNNRFNN